MEFTYNCSTTKKVFVVLFVLLSFYSYSQPFIPSILKKSASTTTKLKANVSRSYDKNNTSPSMNSSSTPTPDFVEFIQYGFTAYMIFRMLVDVTYFLSRLKCRKQGEDTAGGYSGSGDSRRV